MSSQYEESHVETAENIPQDKIRKELESLDKEQVTVTYCNKGVTGNAVQNILINNEFNSPNSSSILLKAAILHTASPLSC